MWKQMIGQEIPIVGQLISEPKYSNLRQYIWIGDGPQTLKTVHDEVELWIPMIFWFNTDVTKALPLIKLLGANLKVNFKFNTSNKLYACADYGGGGAFTHPNISEMELYVNYMETIDEIKNLLSSRSLLTYPVRGYDLHITTLDKSTDKFQGSTKFTKIRGSIESLYIGFRPIENETNLVSWCQQGKYIPAFYKMPVVKDNPVLNTLTTTSAIYYKFSSIINSLQFLVNDVEIYSKTDDSFYNKYMMYKSQNDSYESPVDMFGWNYIDFSLATRDNKQFSNQFGYINFSKNREFRIEYDSSFITNNTQAYLTIISRSVKWFVIKNNTIQLVFV
jgi:hypothetical protein